MKRLIILLSLIFISLVVILVVYLSARPVINQKKQVSDTPVIKINKTNNRDIVEPNITNKISEKDTLQKQITLSNGKQVNIEVPTNMSNSISSDLIERYLPKNSEKK
ncbi:hypothetical protein HY214_04090 [Candidatus Roizmanbacteria bacterium]|nr:hypothetical protein [Candidatus Roizmanbacteria bacterium]